MPAFSHNSAQLPERPVWAMSLLILATIFVCSPSSSEAQTQHVTTAQNVAQKSPSPVKDTRPTWTELTDNQRQALAPLAKAWESLSTGHKRKWIVISQNYQSLNQAEQEKLHGRMEEWAALKPADRTVARLNFAETKKISSTDRNVHWEAYQALSTDEKNQLAAQAGKPKPRVALAVRPVAQEKLTPVPVTRKSTLVETELAALKQSINRNTLLPIAPKTTENTKQ